ncbi:MAG: DUF6448 family protein [Methanobacteriaceae archaeon]|nr:DUF6448 family protein [Methanobacteriaceae archaeon]
MVFKCDSMDGPVVKAAEVALEMENVNYVLAYVSEDDEKELKEAFEKSVFLRELNEDAAEIADYWFFETVVRLHLKSRGEHFQGIKSSKNLDSITRRIKQAMDEENLNDLFEYLSASLENELRKRFMEVLNNKDHNLNDVDDAREYIKSVIDFVEYTVFIQKSIISNSALDKSH